MNSSSNSLHEIFVIFSKNHIEKRLWKPLKKLNHTLLKKSIKWISNDENLEKHVKTISYVKNFEKRIRELNLRDSMKLIAWNQVEWSLQKSLKRNLWREISEEKSLKRNLWDVIFGDDFEWLMSIVSFNNVSKHSLREPSATVFQRAFSSTILKHNSWWLSLKTVFNYEFECS